MAEKDLPSHIQLMIDCKLELNEFHFIYTFGERKMMHLVLDFSQFTQMTQDMQKIVNSVNLKEAKNYLEEMAQQKKEEEVSDEKITDMGHGEMAIIGAERSSDKSENIEPKIS